MNEIFQVFTETINNAPVIKWFIVALLVFYFAWRIALVYNNIIRKQQKRHRNNDVPVSNEKDPETENNDRNSEKHDVKITQETSHDSSYKEASFVSNRENEQELKEIRNDSTQKTKPSIQPEELPETINVEPMHVVSEPDSNYGTQNRFVNYSSTFTDSLNSYPILRIPKKGTIVRTNKTGKQKRRGVMEESFQNTLSAFLPDTLDVLGDVKIDTGKYTRPYEPDIAIISTKSQLNIRINIEIDEPYAGITRKAIHCSDTDCDKQRDNYFVKRGWMVIRFTELQVVLFEQECITFIIQLIKSIDSTFVPIKYPTISNVVIKEKRWDTLQAQKWEKDRYREKYLNIEFPNAQNKNEEKHPVSTFDKQDEIEENLIHPYRNNSRISKKPDRDKRIVFEPEHHIYYIDGVPIPSVSTIIAKLFPKFDADVAIAKMKAGKKWNEHNDNWGKTDEQIKKGWMENGATKARLGTMLHQQIENYLKGKKNETSTEFEFFKKFIEDHNNLKPHKTEWRIFDEDYGFAGTIDFLAKGENGYEMYDWKRSDKIINKNLELITRGYNDQKGLSVLNKTPDTPYYKYCIQQNLYRHILNNKYNINVSKMYLVILHPDYNAYQKLPVLQMDEEIKKILKTL